MLWVSLRDIAIIMLANPYDIVIVLLCMLGSTAHRASPCCAPVTLPALSVTTIRAIFHNISHFYVILD